MDWEIFHKNININIIKNLNLLFPKFCVCPINYQNS